MPKKREDPYPDYQDGNCRDVSGQIVPCGSEQAVSPPKWGPNHPLAGSDEDQSGEEEKPDETK
jgi:hypothetical protein